MVNLVICQLNHNFLKSYLVIIYRHVLNILILNNTDSSVKEKQICLINDPIDQILKNLHENLMHINNQNIK